MRLSRIMHVETDLLNSINNIWASEGEILESTSEASKISPIDKGSTFSSRQLGICINRSGTRFATFCSFKRENSCHEKMIQ